MFGNNDFNNEEYVVPDYLKNWKQAQVNFDPNIKSDQDDDLVIIEYALEDGKTIPVAAKTELLVITGREKSRKTLLLKCMLKSKYVDDESLTMNFRLTKPDALILYFDTEQPIKRTKDNVRRFYQHCKMNKQDPELLFFNIKKLTFSQKIEFITFTIERVTDECGRAPDIVIIDQIGDLVPGRDVNNQEGADDVITYLNKWEEMTGALMVVIVHTNRGGRDTNGKLGVILDQKADSCLLIEINEDGISTVIHRLARDIKIPKFTFRQDFTGRPMLLNVQSNEFNNY